MFRKLDERVSVAGQIAPEQLAEAKAQGFATVINNRPDSEQPGQPTSADMAVAAEAAGLRYVAIPIGHDGFPPDKVAAMGEALGAAEGPVLAFCRSGTRSTYLWALSESARGVAGAELREKAAGAGYDLTPLRGAIG